MSLLTIGSFVFFTALVAIVSWYFTREEDLSTNQGYFLGGRSLTGGVICGSLLLTNLSAEQLVGLNGNGFSGGLMAMSWEATSGVTLVLMGLIFLPKYLKSGFTTVPQFLEERFDKATRNIVTGLFLISLSVITLPVVLYAGGIAVNSLFNVSNMLGISQQQALVVVIAGTGIVGAIYAIFGGLKAVAVSDTINGIGLVIGGLLIPILGLLKLGDNNLAAGFHKLITVHPEKMNAVTGSGTPSFGTIFTGIILVNTFYWCCNQQIVQRAFGAKNLKEGQKGVLYAGVIKIFVPFMLVIPGIIAFHLYKGEITHPDMAYSVLVANVLPTWLVGFFGAVLFGAVLSSFNSALNSASTMFCINVYKPIINPEIDDMKLVKVGKIFGTVMAIFAIVVAPMIAKAPDGLYTFMKSVMGFFNIPTLVVVLMGFASKRIPPIGAKIAICFFIAAYSLYTFVLDIPLHYLHVYGVLFLCCVAIMVVSGIVAPMSKPYQQSVDKTVDLTDWKYAYPVSAVIITTTIFIYVVFSPLGIIDHEQYVTRLLIITALYVISTAVCIYLSTILRKRLLLKNSEKANQIIVEEVSGPTQAVNTNQEPTLIPEGVKNK